VNTQPIPCSTEIMAVGSGHQRGAAGASATACASEEPRHRGEPASLPESSLSETSLSDSEADTGDRDRRGASGAKARGTGDREIRGRPVWGSTKGEETR